MAVRDDIEALKLQYLVELAKLGDSCSQVETQLDGWLQQHDVVFDGATIPFVLMPHFISPHQVASVRHAVNVLSRVLDRFCTAYPDNPELQVELGLSQWEHDLICIDPGYQNPLQICRLDAFLDGSAVKFLEFNADSPAGIGYTDVLYEGLGTNIPLPRVQAEFETEYTPMLPELIHSLLAAYQQVRHKQKDLPENPRLALIDITGSSSVPEFRIMCSAAQAAGMDAVHATVDDLEYDGTTLSVKGLPTPLIYRRALFETLEEGPLIQAARDGRACIVNPFRARVANNKKLLALLPDPRFAHLVDGYEMEVIEQSVPWTRILRSGESQHKGKSIDLISFVVENRRSLVMKPESDWGGHSVALGIETSQSTWEQIVHDHADLGDFIVQEFLPVPEEAFPIVKDGRVQMRLKRFNINPFEIGGHYAGSITRISDQALINISAGGGLLPSVIAQAKRQPFSETQQEDFSNGQKSGTT